MSGTSDDRLDDYWEALVTASLLGTDRRDPPEPPAGGLADLVADTARAAPSSRMLAGVAACVAARRAGFVPGAVAPALMAPPADARPMCPPAAAASWRRIRADWPVLEDEWVLAVIDGGWRLPPDVLVALLARHRGDAVRRARVALAGGPVARWLADHVPALGTATTAGTVAAAAVQSLPELPVPPDLAVLLGADAHTFARTLRGRCDDGAYGPAHRAVLVNLLARCRPDVLAHAAEALSHVEGSSPSAGLGLVLADLARLRATMLDELRPAPR